MPRRRQFHTFPWQAPSVSPRWVHRPLTTVVLPIYNQARYVADSLRSILENETPLEVVLVDDGSTDHLQEALRPFQNDPRVRTISQTNRGLAEALNFGFAAARGSYLSWTSADNRYLPRALDRMSEFLLQNPAVQLVYANVRLIDDAGRPLRQSNYRPADQSPADFSLLLLPLAGNSLLSYPDNFVNACFLFRREALEAVGRYRRDMHGYEDFDYWLRLGAYGQIAHYDSDEPLYEYRLHDASLTSSINPEHLVRETRSHHAKFRALVSAVAPHEGSDDLEKSRPAEPFIHSQHERLLLSEKETAHSGGKVPPPIEVPDILRRSRDSDFRGAQAPTGTTGLGLVFCPDREVLELDALRVPRPFGLAIYCRCMGQIDVAKKFLADTNEASPTTIIDATRDEETDDRWTRLMFVLSSVDFLFSITPLRDELRCEAALSAAAGIPITSAHGWNVDFPHYVELKKLDLPLTGLDHRSLEQWLTEQSPARYIEKRRALAFLRRMD